MEIAPNNHVVKLCARGMDLEGQGKSAEASELFGKAWSDATSDFEKVIAAHYVARHQKGVAEKLRWDETALQLALKVDDSSAKEILPSLYLNVAKCYEDLDDFHNAKTNYQWALTYTTALPDNGYGNMIRGGVAKGLERVTKGTCVDFRDISDPGDNRETKNSVSSFPV